MKSIYVGNLPHATSEETLRKTFEQFGQVDKVNLVVDRETGQSRGFGFVEMPNEAEAQAAIAKMNGAELEGRRLSVNEARPREERGPRRFDDNRGPRRPGGGNGGGNGGFRSRF